MAILAQLASKYLIQILSVLAVFSLYFAWANHQQTIGEEREKVAVAKASEKLMAEEKSKVEVENKDTTARLQNAITIYATRTHNLPADVDSIANRMCNDTGLSKNSVPRSSDDNVQGKSTDNAVNREIAQEIIELANLCEVQINKLKVVD